MKLGLYSAFDTTDIADELMSEFVSAVSRLINEKLNAYSAKGYDYEEASNEVVADALADILPDAHFVEKLHRQHRTLFDEILFQLNAFVQRVKEAFSKMADNNYDGKYRLQEETEDGVRYLESIVKLFDNVALDAVENYQAAMAENKSDPNTANEVQYRSRKNLSHEAGEFRKELDGWDKKGRPEGHTFILGSTGTVFQGLGAIESDVYMLSDKINTIFKEHPEMTVRDIKNIPEILENPVLVLASRNANRGAQMNTRLVVFGMPKAQNGLPVMVVFDLHPTEDNVYLEDMQKVVSAYTKNTSKNGKKRGAVVTKEFIERSDILYADKEKTASLLQAVGFYNAHHEEQSGYVGSITYDRRSVKIEGKPFSEVFSTEDDAKYVDMDALARAQSMEQQEVAAEIIFRETGWFRGADGKWRDKVSNSEQAGTEGTDAQSGGVRPGQQETAGMDAGDIKQVDRYNEADDEQMVQFSTKKYRNSNEPTSSREWSAFNRSLSYKTSGMKDGDRRSLLIFTDANAYFVDATGYMMYDSVEKVRLSGNKKYIDERWEAFKNVDDKDGRTVDSWVEVIRDELGGNIGNTFRTSEGETAARAGSLDGGKSQRYSTGDYQEDNGTHGIDDDINYRLRDSLMDDREVVDAMAGELDAEDITRWWCPSSDD